MVYVLTHSALYPENVALIVDSTTVGFSLTALACMSLCSFDSDRPYITMCDFHNFDLIFAGQCTVCLKG